jgi:hypothetical protein
MLMSLPSVPSIAARSLFLKEFAQAFHRSTNFANTFTDYGMRSDNSGKNAHYAPIRWSNHS